MSIEWLESDVMPNQWNCYTKGTGNRIAQVYKTLMDDRLYRCVVWLDAEVGDGTKVEVTATFSAKSMLSGKAKAEDVRDRLVKGWEEVKAPAHE